MKPTFPKLAAAAACAALMSSSATGVEHQGVWTIPALKPNLGRIYFLRSSVMQGAAIKPEIRLNGLLVGVSKPGGFFYIDRAPGSYRASATADVETTLSFTLAAGETKYIRTSQSSGDTVVRIVMDFETPENALAELPSLRFTGGDAELAPER